MSKAPYDGALLAPWPNRFLRLAEEVATWSKDGSTKVGAVIVNADRRVIATGYNGFPSCLPDEVTLLLDREERLRRTVHAEVNAVLNAVAAVKGCAMFVTHFPCPDNCAKFVMAAGIGEVHVREPSADFMGRWCKESTVKLFREARRPLIEWNAEGTESTILSEWRHRL